MRFWPPPEPGATPQRRFDEPVEIARQVDEGYLVALSALRLSIKNGVILATVRDGVPWDEESATELATAAIDTLSLELTATAQRLDAASADAVTAAPHSNRSRSDRAKTAQATAESRRLAARSRTVRGVSERLTAARHNMTVVRELVLRARDDTLTELMQARLVPRATPQTLSPDEHRAAIDSVKAELDAMLAARELPTDW